MEQIKRHIAIITPTLLIKGGTQNQLMHLALECQKGGDVCEIFTFAYFPSETFEEFSDIQVNSVFYLSQNSFFVRVLRYVKVDLQAFFLYLSFLLKYKFLDLFSGKNFDVLNPHDWFGAWIAVDAKNKFRMSSKVIVMLNDMPPFASSEHGIKNYFSGKMDLKKRNGIDTIMVLDNKMRDKAREYYGNDPVVEVVRSGIDIDRFRNFRFDKRQKKQELTVNDEEFLFVCASIPAPHRRFEDAIVSLQNSPTKARLLIIGNLSNSKKYGESLVRLTRNLQLEDRVIFISAFLPFQERNEYIAAADAFIFPNENQTWGLGVIEAMALGVPCIVSNGAGVHEVLTNEKNALIYNVSNINELTSCMKNIMEKDTLREKLISNGKSFVSDRFSWSKYKDSVYSIFFEKQV